MTITFPHLGNVYLAIKALFDTLEIPYIVPEMNNRQTLKKGSAVSPEEICLPFKIVMGNILNGIERGADTVLTVASCGPCRFGEYCELQIKLLKSLGKEVRVIVIDSPTVIGKEAFFERIGYISSASNKTRMQKMRALRHTMRILHLADDVDALAYDLAGYETKKGECKRLLHACKREVFACDNADDMQRVLLSYKDKLRNIEKDNSRCPIKVSLIGEIFSMIEPFSNFYIEEKLMDYGISSSRMLTPSWWIRDLVLKPLKLNSLNIKKAARPYMPLAIGGHAKESIAHAVMARKGGMDGVIQIFPLGCMPEIVTKAVLPNVQQATDLPVLTLVVDEMTGEAGYVTRIEAFLDMLAAKKTTEERLGATV